MCPSVNNVTPADGNEWKMSLCQRDRLYLISVIGSRIYFLISVSFTLYSTMLSTYFFNLYITVVGVLHYHGNIQCLTLFYFMCLIFIVFQIHLEP